MYDKWVETNGASCCAIKFAAYDSFLLFIILHVK